MTRDAALTEQARCLAAATPNCPVVIPHWVARVLLDGQLIGESDGAG